MTKNEINWLSNYNALKEYIAEHRHLPDKKKVENRGLLNWWKYNKKRIKNGKLDAEHIALLQELSDMRDSQSRSVWSSVSTISIRSQPQ